MSERPLRCWPGCLAEIFGLTGFSAANNGRRCIVLERASLWEPHYPESGPLWFIQPLAPMVSTTVDIFTGPIGNKSNLLARGVMCDRNMRPIEDDERDTVEQRNRRLEPVHG